MFSTVSQKRHDFRKEAIEEEEEEKEGKSRGKVKRVREYFIFVLRSHYSQWQNRLFVQATPSR